MILAGKSQQQGLAAANDSVRARLSRIPHGGVLPEAVGRRALLQRLVVSSECCGTQCAHRLACPGTDQGPSAGAT